ncbi:hypothetical protein AVEN_41773-1 [Araneus ventricosus]|uniref:SOCS box domain-containing protein n=1 Tax=Araneus ventricosus TaxID=182803 RepID=A0A4Y2ACD7_ARAVE|nr:hypothetical protein AVEN_41773-1 [Araneus ventricosus]
MAFQRHRFYSTLRHSAVEIVDARNIVQCSFLLHKSITYLDLNLSEYGHYRLGRYIIMGGGHRRLTWRNFINTEDSCRKVLIPARRLLYTLHLDIPQGREFNLRNGPITRHYDYNSESIHVDIRIKDIFFHSLFFSILECAFVNGSDKLKLIRWLLDFAPPELANLPNRILNHFLTEMHLECTDSIFVNKCLKKFHLIGSICRQEQPKILEYLLYHANKSAYSTKKCPSSKPSFIDMCISSLYLLNIGPYLKYRNEACFSTSAYTHFKRYLYLRKENLTRQVLEKAEGWMSKKRNHRLLQILMLFYHNYPDRSVPPEVLRLIWNSIPDAFITLEEIRNAYDGVLSDTEMGNIYNYYTAAIGETSQRQGNTPRSLLHYSRVSVRRILFKNKHWLPDGISQLCIPKCLHSFLNLEMQMYGCVHLMDTRDSSSE